MESVDAATLRPAADKILDIRNKKYPPTMKCAGSIFKNFLLAELPGRVASEIPAKAIIEGKVPSAWFLEQVGAKGMRIGDIRVADYHANLIYNAGAGTAQDLVAIIAELKQRVERQWGIPLEEEVQYVGQFRESLARLTPRLLILTTAAASLIFAAAPPSGESLLKRAIEKSGGAQAYAKAKSVSMTGKVEIEGRNISGTVTLLEEGKKSYTAMEFAGIGKVEEGYDGETAWEDSALQGPRLLEGDEKAAAKRASILWAIAAWREVFADAKTIGPADVEGKPAWQVEMIAKEGKPETWFFDRDSGLLVKTSGVLSTAMGDLTTEVVNSDFRAVDGILGPLRHDAESHEPDHPHTLRKNRFQRRYPGGPLRSPQLSENLEKK